MTAVYHTAAAAGPQPDPAALDFLVRSIADPDPVVRRAAVDAALVAFWPELREPLERVADADPDPDLRAFARETRDTLRDRVWDAPPGSFDFVPLPPDPQRITPATGIRDEWFRQAFSYPPKAPVPPNPMPPFTVPDWLAELIQAADWEGVRWHSPEAIRTASTAVAEFEKSPLVRLHRTHLVENKALWKSMVPVADGPAFTDRAAMSEQSRLFVNRDDPSGILLALGGDHPPTLWVPVGRTRAEFEAVAAAYFFAGLPPRASLPFQARLFLSTQIVVGEFEEVERMMTLNEFTDKFLWGSAHADDPYPPAVTLGQIPFGAFRWYMAQNPSGLRRTCVRTRFSRSVIELIDWQDGYFADLYFRPAPPAGFAEAFNRRDRTGFPPGTPVDVIGALLGLACFGPDPIRDQAEAATDPDQRDGMRQLIGFLEQAPSLD